MMQSQTGILELSSRADGRLRVLDKTLLATPSDPVVPAKFIERYKLRPGLVLEVELSQVGGGGNGHHQQQQQRDNHHGKKNKQRHKANAIAPNCRASSTGLPVLTACTPEEYLKRRRFDELTSIDPSSASTLEYTGCPLACRR